MQLSFINNYFSPFLGGNLWKVLEIDCILILSNNKILVNVHVKNLVNCCTAWGKCCIILWGWS